MRFQLTALCTGALQGGLFWWLWRARKLVSWPATEPLLYTALLYAVFAVPLVVYFTQGIERLPVWARRAAMALYLVLYAALGAYTAWSGGATTGTNFDLNPASVLAAAVLGFVSLSLFCGFDFEARRWDYARLFNYTWRNGILAVTAGAMTAAVWLVLLAGANLMALIGLNGVLHLIEEPAFICVASATVFASAFSLGLTRASMAEAIRRFWLSISSWLLPLVLFFGVFWAVAVPFTGLEPLFKTKQAALIMLWFAALAVKFSNCAYQDGSIPAPYPAWLGRTLQTAWLSLLPMVGIAWWALGLRVADHGLSEQRLWAGLVATLAAIYAVGYSLSWLKRDRWMSAIARTNIAAAIVLCLGLVALLTPVANVQRLGVSFHLQHVAASDGATEPDWKYLRWRSGRFGREALHAIAEGQGAPAGGKWEKHAKDALAQTERHNNLPATLSEADVRARLPVFPAQRALPATFVKYVQTSRQDWLFQRCFEPGASCVVWLGDLSNDGQDEILLFNYGQQAQGNVFMPFGETWKQAGHFSSRSSEGKFNNARVEAAQIAKPEWNDLMIDGRRIRLQMNP